MDYNSDQLSNLGRQATIFLIHRFLTSALLKHRITKILSNTNDDGDNNEKTGVFKNIGGNIPGGNFLGGNFPGGNFPGESLMGGNFPCRSFPDTVIYM